MEVTFLHPVYLTFLVCVPFFIIMHFLILKHIRRRAIMFANFEALQRVTGGQVLNKNITILVIRLLALVFLVLSLSGPILWYTGKASNFDFVLAIDVSSSMLADDFSPNRMEVAKSAASFFLSKLPRQTKVGLVTFSGTSFVHLLPTEDIGLVQDTVKELGVSRVGGTNIGDAIITSTNLFTGLEKAKAIVLLTDGQSNVGTPVEDAIDYANKNMVTIHTIGVGTETGGKFIRYTEAVSQLDAATLNKTSALTGGRFFRAENEEELRNAYEELTMPMKQKVAVRLQIQFMLASLLLLFFEWGLINTRFRTLP